MPTSYEGLHCTKYRMISGMEIILDKKYNITVHLNEVSVMSLSYDSEQNCLRKMWHIEFLPRTPRSGT